MASHMGLIAWIIFGALAGWIASLITGTGKRHGCFLHVVIGVVGAFIGGIIVEYLTGRGFNFGFNPSSFAVAIMGAVILLAIAGIARKAFK